MTALRAAQKPKEKPAEAGGTQLQAVKVSKEQLNQQFVNDYAAYQTAKILRQKALGEAKDQLNAMKQIQERLDANCPELATGKLYDDLQMVLPFANDEGDEDAEVMDEANRTTAEELRRKPQATDETDEGGE